MRTNKEELNHFLRAKPILKNCNCFLLMDSLTFKPVLYTFALMNKSKQLQFDQAGFKKEKSDHGGSHKHPQKRKRPLGFRSTNHLVLRSTKAVKKWSFKNFDQEIQTILNAFSKKHHIQLLSWANVGNHLHLHFRVPSRKLYRKFIRAISSAIMMKVTGFNRWNPSPEGFQFWDRRPFSRIVSTWAEFMNLKQYVQINRWEGCGIRRSVARDLVARGLLARSGGSGSG